MADTRDKQLELWEELIPAFCRHERRHVLRLDNTNDMSLFHNTSIHRKLKPSDIHLVLQHLVDRKLAFWMDSTQTACGIFWKSADTWAKELHQWALANGRQHSVMTVFDLDEIRPDEGEWTSLPVAHLIEVLRILEKEGMVALFHSEDATDDLEMGVKFV